MLNELITLLISSFFLFICIRTSEDVFIGIWKGKLPEDASRHDITIIIMTVTCIFAIVLQIIRIFERLF
jgi:hypothetical protein